MPAPKRSQAGSPSEFSPGTASRKTPLRPARERDHVTQNCQEFQVGGGQTRWVGRAMLTPREREEHQLSRQGDRERGVQHRASRRPPEGPGTELRVARQPAPEVPMTNRMGSDT